MDPRAFGFGILAGIIMTIAAAVIATRVNNVRWEMVPLTVSALPPGVYAS